MRTPQCEVSRLQTFPLEICQAGLQLQKVAMFSQVQRIVSTVRLLCCTVYTVTVSRIWVVQLRL